MQILKAAGASLVVMIGLNTDRERLELATKLGADVIVDVENADMAGRVMAATGGKGVDLVFEASGYPINFTHALRMLVFGGQVIAIAGYSGPTDFDPSELVIGSKSIIGSLGHEAQTWKRSLALVTKGIVAPERLITHILSMEEAEQGFELAVRKEAVKVLFKTKGGN